MSKSLGLIYGAFFGFRVLQDDARYTRYGQVKDDVERTLRYWHADGVVLRFNRYGVEKAQKPGLYFAKKGGISADSSAVKHEAKGKHALHAMIKEFASPYARLALPTETRHQPGKLWLYWLNPCNGSVERKADKGSAKRKADKADTEGRKPCGAMKAMKLGLETWLNPLTLHWLDRGALHTNNYA